MMNDKEFADFVAGVAVRIARATMEISTESRLTNEQTLALFEKVGDEIRALAFDFKAGVHPAKSARDSYDRIYGDGKKETN